MVRQQSALVIAALLLGSVAPLAQAKPQAPAKPAPRTPAGPAPQPAKPAAPPAPAPPSAALQPPPPPPATDVRFKTSITHGAQVSHNVTYLQGPRQRVEFPGVVSLDQCDLERTVMLNVPAKRYQVEPYPDVAASPPTASVPDPQAAQIAAAQKGQPRGGVVTLTTSITDTLERQTILGLEARRIKTVMVKQASSNACDKSPMKVEVDAWYVDLPQQSACERPSGTTPPPPSDPALCTDRVETRVVGDAKLGFPVRSVTTTTGGEGDKADVSTSLQEVTELEISRLDKSLFDVPADFVEAKSSAEIVRAIATGESLSDAIYGSTADGSSDAAPKKPGTIRIGVLEPVNKTDRNLPPSRLRQDLVTRLTKAPYEAVALKGSSPSAILADAARLECDYVMLAEVVEAKTSKPGKLGGVMKLTGGGAPKDSHDAKVDYKLFAVTAPESPRVSGSAKASSGGVGMSALARCSASRRSPARCGWAAGWRSAWAGRWE